VLKESFFNLLVRKDYKQRFTEVGMMPVSDMITDKQWRWLCRVLGPENINNAKVSFTWSPEGRRRRGTPKTTWHRMVESEWCRLGFALWTQIENMGKDHARWKELACALTYHPEVLEV